MDIRFVNLPLYSAAFYSYSISLERVSYTIKFRYITRTQRWVFDLYTRDKQPVLLGQAIIPNYPISLDYVTPLSGFFWLTPLPDVDPYKAEQYPRDLDKYYSFDYVYEKVGV